MKRSLSVLVMILMAYVPLFAQYSISGPTEVCPNTTVRYTITGCAGGGSFSMVVAPSTYTILAQTSTYIDIQFPDYNGGNSYVLQAGLASCGAVFITKNIKVKSIGPSISTNESLACEFMGTKTFEQSFSPYASSWSASTNTGWVFESSSVTPAPGGGNTVKLFYGVNNFNSGYVKIAVKSSCTNMPDIERTFNVTKNPSTTLPQVTWSGSPATFCVGGSAIIAVQPYFGAVSYTWTSDQPSLKINGQSSPVTTTTPSVTLNETTNGYTANVSVTAQTACGTTIPASRPVRVDNGVPDLATVILENSLGQTGFACYTDAFNIAKPIMSPGPGYNYLNVQVVPPTGSPSNFTTTGEFVVPTRRAGWHTMYVTPVNGCGTGNTIEYEFEAIDCTVSPIVMAYKAPAEQSVIASPAFVIRPNPARNETTVVFGNSQPGKGKSEITLIQVLDMNGRVLLEQRTASHNTSLRLDTHTLSAGIYVVKVIQGTEVKTAKLMIAK